MVFCILPHDEFVFQDKNTGGWGVGEWVCLVAVYFSLRQREKISDLWMVVYRKSRAMDKT